MSAPVLSLVISTAGIIFCILLFRFEQQRGVRFFKTFRLGFDKFVFTLQNYLHNIIFRFGKSVLRQIFHYGLHSFLKNIVALLRRTENRLVTVLKVNRTMVRNINKEKIEGGHLNIISQHKNLVALTPEEEKKIKEDVLDGKV